MLLANPYSALVVSLQQAEPGRFKPTISIAVFISIN
jgi:hypothetical protein